MEQSIKQSATCLMRTDFQRCGAIWKTNIMMAKNSGFFMSLPLRCIRLSKISVMMYRFFHHHRNFPRKTIYYSAIFFTLNLIILWSLRKTTTIISLSNDMQCSILRIYEDKNSCHLKYIRNSALTG